MASVTLRFPAANLYRKPWILNAALEQYAAASAVPVAIATNWTELMRLARHISGSITSRSSRNKVIKYLEAPDENYLRVYMLRWVDIRLRRQTVTTIFAVQRTTLVRRHKSRDGARWTAMPLSEGQAGQNKNEILKYVQHWRRDWLSDKPNSSSSPSQTPYYGGFSR